MIRINLLPVRAAKKKDLGLKQLVLLARMSSARVRLMAFHFQASSLTVQAETQQIVKSIL